MNLIAVNTTPVPEPNALLTLLAGWVALPILRAQRRRTRAGVLSVPIPPS
jgi:hypothetical protein